MSEERPEGDDDRARSEAVDVGAPPPPEGDPLPPPEEQHEPPSAPLPVPFPEDEETGDQMPPPPPPPASAAPAPRRGRVAMRDDRPVLLVIGAVVALLVVAVLVALLVRTLSGDDDGADDVVPTGPLATVVPDLAASPVMLGPDDRRALLTEMLATGRHDVATDTPAGVLCAAVVLDAPLEAIGRWERDGQQIAVTDASQVGPPGFGDCIDDGGNRLEDGAYQFLVTDVEGHESAAGTLVLGAPPIAQPFVNDGAEPVCELRIAPSTAGYFEAYDLSTTPLAPGGTIALVIADVEQAVRTTGCGEKAAALASFEFDPDPTATRSLAP